MLLHQLVSQQLTYSMHLATMFKSTVFSIVSSFLGNVDALKLIYNKNRKILHLVAKDRKFANMSISIAG